MASITEILAQIDEKAPYSMVIEASVRDYCVLALQFLRGEVPFDRYFESALPNPMPVMEKEVSARQCASKRYCVQLYAPSEEALLADDRIFGVDNFQLSHDRKGNVLCKFDVHTVYGTVSAQREVKTRV